jgi:hypothetical protein
MRAFGCHIYALSTKNHDDKLTTENIPEGKILRYGGSMNTFIYENILTKRRARATHATFDEARLSTLESDLSPNSRVIRGALARSTGPDTPGESEVLTPPENFCIFSDTSTFLNVHTLMVSIKCTFNDYGLFFETDPMSNRNIIADVTPFSSISHMEWATILQFHMAIQVTTVPVFMVHGVQLALAAMDVAIHASLTLIVTPYRPDPMDQQAPLPQVVLDQLRVIHCVIHDWDFADPAMLITVYNAANMTDIKTHTK